MPFPKLISALFFFFLAILLKGQTNITNFSRALYGGGMQNWAFESDKEGRIFVANNEGLLVFTGNVWTLYPTPNNTIVRSIAFGNDGKLYVGGQDEIGYFTPDANGKFVYNSLLSLINLKERQFADVWNIVVNGNHVFFRTSSKLFVLHNSSISIYKTNTQWDFLGTHNKQVIAFERGKGLLLFSKANFQPFFSAAETEKNISITSSTPFQGGTLLTTTNSGLFKLENNKIAPFSIKTNSLNNEYFTCAKQLLNKTVLIGTYDNGLLQLDSSGNVIKVFSANNGLNSNNIKCIFEDKNKFLWLGLEDGISVLDIQYPITWINPDYFNGAAGYSAALHNNKIYFSLANGIYVKPLDNKGDFSVGNAAFKKIANGLSWRIITVGENLYAGTDDGFFEIKNDVLIPIDKTTGFWIFKTFGNNENSANKFVAGNYLGISIYNKINNSYVKEADLSKLNISARYVEYDSLKNSIWISHPYRGVYQISLKDFSIKQYTQKDGLPSALNNHIFKIKNQIVVATVNGVYVHNNQTNSFIESNTFSPLFKGKSIRYLQEDKKGNIWFVQEKKVGLANFATNSIIYFNELQQKILSGFENILVLNNNQVLIGAEKGFFLINANLYNQKKLLQKVMFTNISSRNITDSTLYAGGGGYNFSAKKILSRKWNSFHFQFSSPFSSQLVNIQYACRLIGFEENWSEWNTKTEKFYTNLPAGSYEFQVKALNNLNEQSEITSYLFEIKPAWYSSIWFKFFLFVLMIFTIYKIHIFQKSRVIKKQEEKQANEIKAYQEKQLMLSYEHQIELERTEKELAQLKNENLEAELASTAMNLVQKKEFILRIKDEVSKLNKTGKDVIDTSELKKILKRLTAEDKLDDEWEQFSIHFDKVHGSFLNNVKKHFPDLKAHELKLCAYIRLNLSSKEIAQLMSISVRGVEISRYRLRKKMQVPSKEDLYKYLVDLGTA